MQITCTFVWIIFTKFVVRINFILFNDKTAVKSYKKGFDTRQMLYIASIGWICL